MKHFTRRAFLRTLGAAGAALPFHRLLQSSVAEAATPAPLRFIAIFTPHGMVPEYWWPKGGETDFNITYPNAMLAPLNRHRSKINIMAGLDYRALEEFSPPITDGHTVSRGTFLTGQPYNGSTGDIFPEKGPSIDQYLASRLNPPTLRKTYGIRIFDTTDNPTTGNTLSFDDRARTLTSSERNPAKVWDTFFKGFAPPGQPNQPNEPDPELLRKKSVVDFLSKQTSAMRNRLAGAERSKLDAHMSALSGIEQRINLVVGGGGPNAESCSPPSYPGSPYNLSNAENAENLARLHFDLLAQTLACDLVRFVTVHFEVGVQMPFPSLNLKKSIHDDIAHNIGSDSNPNVPARLELAKVQNWYAEQIATFMDRLSEIPEGSGSVLDNTIILWGNELGDPSLHNHWTLPTVLAGGAGGKFRMGRYMTLRGSMMSQYGNPIITKAYAHNHLLISICQAFGLDVNTFGHPAYTGGVSGLFA